MSGNAHRRGRVSSIDASLLAFMEGVAHLGVTFIPIVAALKRPVGKLHRYERAQEGASAERRLELALSWLTQGWEIGFLPSNRLYVVDADTAEAAAQVEAWAVQRCLRPPAISTPRGGGHFYFMLPEGLSTVRLKAHVLKPRDPSGNQSSIDFKFPGRTLVKLIGRSENEITYRVQHEWKVPPPLDPREFFPSLQLYHPTDQRWIPSDRPLRDRILRGRVYLARRAPISVSGRRGRTTLLGVCTHLTRYLQLEPRLAYWLLTTKGQGGCESWNDRCRDSAGAPYPWSPNELITALDESMSHVPAQGVQDNELRQKKVAMADALAKFFSEVQRSVDLEVTESITMADLRKTFCGWYGQGEMAVLPIPFGKAAAKAGLNIIQVTRAKVSGVRGVDQKRLLALLESLGPLLGSAS